MTKAWTKRLLTVSALLAAATVGTTAFAQQGGFTLDQFQAAPAGDRFFGVQGGDPGGRLLPRLMLLGDYAYRPLVLYRGSSEERVGNVVSNQAILHLAASVSLWNVLSLSADMPLTLLNNGDSPTISGLATTSPSGFAAGDLRAGLRVRLIGEPDSIVSLSLAGYLFLPTGKQSQFAGDGSVHGAPALVLSGEGDSFAYAVTAGADVRSKDTIASTNTTLGSRLTFGGAVGLLLADRQLQIGPEVYGTTVMTGSDRFERATTNVEGILGLRARLGAWVLGAGAGPGITRGLGTPTVRGVLSVAYVPVPEKPLPPKPLPPRRPAPPSDKDKDGIPDSIDACPDVPGVRSTDPTKNGCPPPPPDRDGDGIFDKDDACPDLKGLPNDDPTQNGCPPDTDGDGIRDDVDACPNEKGKPDPDPQKNGCPKAVRVTDNEIVILEQVQFKTGSAVILKTSDDLLSQVAMVLSEHPEIQKIEVQGHTDNRGGKAYNHKLSEKRAAAVVKWLVNKGNVGADRLISHGYGMEDPISDNVTPEGRQKNRRVQFKIIEKSSAGKSEVSP